MKIVVVIYLLIGIITSAIGNFLYWSKYNKIMPLKQNILEILFWPICWYFFLFEEDEDFEQK